MSAVRWAGLWAAMGALLGVASLLRGGVGHLSGWMAPVTLALLLGGAGLATGLVFGVVARAGDRSFLARGTLGAICGAAVVGLAGLVPFVGIASGSPWPLLIGAALGLLGAALPGRD